MSEWSKVANMIEDLEWRHLPKVARPTDRAALLADLRKISREYDRLCGACIGLEGVLAEVMRDKAPAAACQPSKEALPSVSQALQKLVWRLLVLQTLCQMAKQGRPRGSKIDPETDLCLAVRAADILRNAEPDTKQSVAMSIRQAIAALEAELGVKLPLGMTSAQAHERRIRRTLAHYAEQIEMTPDLKNVDYLRWIPPAHLLGHGPMLMSQADGS